MLPPNDANMARIEIYTTRYCGYCHSAKALLARKGVPFDEIDVTADPDGRSRMVERSKGRYTVPQIFIGDTHVGGSDELHALNREGRLDPLLDTEGIVAASAPNPNFAHNERQDGTRTSGSKGVLE
jgi:glutaredoxin 3